MMSLVPILALVTALQATPADSIYTLAVDSAKYPQESLVLLLDYGALKRETDGTGSTTFRTVAQVLKQSAVSRFQEQSFSYSPGHERFTLNWARVLNTKGEVISEAPTHVQDSDVPAQRGNPVYADQKIKRISLTGVAPGTIVDVSYTREELKPFLPSDFIMSWRVTASAPVMRSYFGVDVPAEMNLHIREQNLNFKRTDRAQSGRRLITWVTKDVPVLKPELFTPDSLQAGMFIDVSGPVEWRDIAKWYADNARGRYEPSPALRSKVSEAVRGAATLDDSIARVHKWVAQDIRYVAIALGLGGYQPRLPDSVMKTGFGDCKDKATLFITALKLFGVKAYPVILNSFGRVRETVPSVHQFNHLIAAYDRGKNRHYVDLTADLVPLGRVPTGYWGAFALLVHEDGKSEQVRLPTWTSAENRITTRLKGKLTEDGQLAGWFEQSAVGSPEVLLRSMVRAVADSATRERFKNRQAEVASRGAESDSLEIFEAKDFSAKPTVRVRFSNKRGAEKPSESVMILSLPYGGGGSAQMLTMLEKQPKRMTPVDLSFRMPAIMAVHEVDIDLPPGWKAKLPSNVSVNGLVGINSVTYQQEGNTLRVRRTSSNGSGVVGPEKWADVLEWFRNSSKDDARFIVVERQP